MNDGHTYSLPEVASLICGNDLKDPERWVLRRIYSGQFRALKVGRTYRMTQEQLDEAISSLEPQRPAFPDADVSGPTAASLRRRTRRT